MKPNKKDAKKFLIFEYTSSDESELSEDETGPDVKRFVTKRLAWEGPKLRELKDVLDLAHKRSLKPHVRNFQTERVVDERFSSRGPPPDAPKWTLKSGFSPVATSLQWLQGSYKQVATEPQNFMNHTG